MTAFNTSDLPASIDTVEKLVAWGNTVLNYLYPSNTVIENVGEATRMAQSAPFEITAQDPIEWRLISRSSLKLNNTWLNTGKLWENIQPIGSSTIPTGFKS